MKDYDAIVIGGGINGLTTAAYLQKAGLSVKSGEEEVKAREFLAALRSLASAAGGDAPLPACPASQTRSLRICVAVNSSPLSPASALDDFSPAGSVSTAPLRMRSARTR